MKKTISLIISVSLLLSCFLLFSHADGVVIDYCVTWKLYPHKAGDSRAEIAASYIAVQCRAGYMPVPPDVTPTYASDDGYEYRFLGWEKADVDRIKSYLEDPTLGYTAKTFVQKEFEPITGDVVYVAVYERVVEKEKIPGDLDRSGVADIADVTLLLNYLAGLTADIDLELADVNGDGDILISDVTALLLLLK